MPFAPPPGSTTSPQRTAITGAYTSTNQQGNTPSGSVPGTSTTWHTVVLWFLGAIALLAIASPAPNVATWIAVILIVLVLFKNWPVYQTYLGLGG